MRLQLTSFFTPSLILLSVTALGQNEFGEGANTGIRDSSDTFRQLNETEVNFLFSYYEQDGIHSAVTGGLGTEELDDISSTIIVNVPLDSISSFNAQLSVNQYSSASTDMIDMEMSSASSKDFRGEVYLTYTKKIDEHLEFSVTGGASAESDYLSRSIGASITRFSEDENSAVSLSASAFFDKWQLFFPDEIRGDFERTGVSTDRRNSYNFSISYSQVINTRLQVALVGELVCQNGLLSTPFHRVFFQDDDIPFIERLPEDKFRYPLGFRANYFVSDFLVLRSYYRFYTDNFGVTSNTFEIEPALKAGNYFTFYPFYRFYDQSEARYFAPFQEHIFGEEFYTSDFDLSSFQSHKYGIGLKYSPLLGIGRFYLPFSRRKTVMFKEIETRYADYKRSDGLDAWLITANLGFLVR